MQVGNSARVAMWGFADIKIPFNHQLDYHPPYG